MTACATYLVVAFLVGVALARPESSPRHKTVTIADNVEMPMVLLGTGYMPPPGEGAAWQNATAVKNVKAWIELGGRGIDTALMYNVQEGVSAAIKASGVSRDQIFVLTKIPGVGNYSTVMEWLEADYAQLDGPMDVVLSHWCAVTTQDSQDEGSCTKENIVATWTAMEDFYKQGKARAIGVSNYCIENLNVLLANATIVPHVHQVERHPGYSQKEMVAFCKEKNIHLQSYAPLGDADRQSKAGPEAKALLQHPVITRIASAHNVSPAQLLLLWQMQEGHSSTPRVTTVNQDHMKENIAVLTMKAKLSASEIQEIEAIHSMPKCWPAVGVCN